MRERLYNLLRTISDHVYLQGTAPVTLPESFITYTVADVAEGRHYDNGCTVSEWMFYVNIYSTSPLDIEETRKRVYNLLKDEGYRCTRKGMDVPSGTSTHTGWAMTFMALEKQ